MEFKNEITKELYEKLTPETFKTVKDTIESLIDIGIQKEEETKHWKNECNNLRNSMFWMFHMKLSRFVDLRNINEFGELEDE